MNLKIKELKIKNYKKKIKKKYDFLEIKNIYYDDENKENNEYVKRAIQPETRGTKNEIFLFSFYDNKEKIFFDKKYTLEIAKNKFINLFDFFNNDDTVLFNVEYYKESFLIECCFEHFKCFFKKIDIFDDHIILNNKPRDKILYLFKLEYEYEVAFKNYILNI